MGPLRSEPFQIDGRFELRVLVPEGDALRIADLRDVNVTLDQTSVVNDVRRLTK